MRDVCPRATGRRATIPRAARGFALALVLAVLALLGVVGAIVHAQLAARRQAQLGEERRAQALWLARSAAASQKPLQREVEVGGERAALVVRATAGRVEAEVRFGRWGRARVTAEGAQGWEERWEPAR